MKQIVPIAFVVMIAATAPHLSTVLAAAAERARVAAGTVKVTVNYKGKGTVDGSHRVWVWLFTSPDIGPDAMPIAELTVDTNGGVATFEGISAERVWIAVAFDEQGMMSGNAPPPSGTPVGSLHGRRRRAEGRGARRGRHGGADVRRLVSHALTGPWRAARYARHAAHRLVRLANTKVPFTQCDR